MLCNKWRRKLFLYKFYHLNHLCAHNAAYSPRERCVGSASPTERERDNERERLAFEFSFLFGQYQPVLFPISLIRIICTRNIKPVLLSFDGAISKSRAARCCIIYWRASQFRQSGNEKSALACWDGAPLSLRWQLMYIQAHRTCCLRSPKESSLIPGQRKTLISVGRDTPAASSLHENDEIHVEGFFMIFA